MLVFHGWCLARCALLGKVLAQQLLGILELRELMPLSVELLRNLLLIWFIGDHWSWHAALVFFFLMNTVIIAKHLRIEDRRLHDVLAGEALSCSSFWFLLVPRWLDDGMKMAKGVIFWTALILCLAFGLDRYADCFTSLSLNTVDIGNLTLASY